MTAPSWKEWLLGLWTATVIGYLLGYGRGARALGRRYP